MRAESKRKSPRHPFRFKIQLDEHEPPQVVTIWATVKKATKPVQLILTAADVRRSMKLRGVGNTATCSMAVCAKRQAKAFPHPVAGYIDWQYRTAYVVTKLDKKTGFPSECVVYDHADEIARLNDSPGGQQKLLERLEQQGDRAIFLRPPDSRRRSRVGKPEGVNDLSRSPRPAYLSSDAMKKSVGARLRYATAQAGGVLP